MKFSEFKTDKKAELEGVEIDVDGAGFKITIARASNPNAKKYLRKLIKPYLKLARKDAISDDMMEDIEAKVYSKHILLGWKGLENDDGSPLEYSEETCYNKLRESSDFFDVIKSFADDRDNFRKALMEESEGN